MPSSENSPSLTEDVGVNAVAGIETKTAGVIASAVDKLHGHVGDRLKRVVKNGGGIFYAMGGVTQETPKTEYSLPLRARRAHAVHEAKNATREERKGIIGQEKARIKATEELYNHTLHEVDTEYGTIGGQVSILNHENTKDIPIVFVPGSSNDPESIESFAVEMAVQTGRRIILIGYPDSPNGKTNQQFTDAVVKGYEDAKNESKKTGKPRAPTYKPYVQFFDKQIQDFVPEGDFYLAGFSAGAAISAKLISGEHSYSNRVKDALILNPVGSSTFSDRTFNIGTTKQSLFSLADGRRFPQFTWMDDPRDPNESEDKSNKLKSWEALYKGTHTRIPDWENMKVKVGGDIVVFSGMNDYITRSFDTFSATKKPKNDQLSVIADSAHHNTIGTHSTEVMTKILIEMPQLKVAS